MVAALEHQRDIPELSALRHIDIPVYIAELLHSLLPEHGGHYQRMLVACCCELCAYVFRQFNRQSREGNIVAVTMGEGQNESSRAGLLIVGRPITAQNSDGILHELVDGFGEGVLLGKLLQLVTDIGR